jgi:hypothetical protein
MSMDDVIRQMRKRDEMMRRLAEGPLGDPRTRELILGRTNEAARALDMMEKNSVAKLIPTFHRSTTTVALAAACASAIGEHGLCDYVPRWFQPSL